MVEKALLQPAFPLQERLLAQGLQVTSCYQCRKCSGGCPLTFAMDLLPDRVIRLALLGQEDQVLGCRTIWVCSSCQTCTTRCPNGIDIAGVMDWLKEEALRRGKTLPEPEVAEFHRLFMDSVLWAGGRVPEARLVRRFTLFKMRRKLDVKELLENGRLGWNLFKRGRLRLKGPRPLKHQAEIQAIFRKSGF